ncbi:HAD-IIIA family hydrolase [Saccharophagus sp. K07]|uniref:HAD-IA family hydrolase n=1 Tax=Saccharophagus sp. K07 TaxID=2283636 RepID=UPI001652B65F|nr:HAD-IA family hydrolase [Saccharophagus sp. K07]MBC6904868.1 HAD-IIIA family hydrolase [Saccharophagus sp. K07]
MLFIFDWDGTLCDSTGKIVRCMQLAAHKLGLPDLHDVQVLEIIGLGLPEAVNRLFPGISAATAEALKQEYSEFFLEDTTPMPFFNGVEETLHRLRGSGYQLAIATGKSRRGLNRILEDMGLQNFFHASRCADETCSKPDPKMLLELLTEFRRPADQAVMVGDTEFDMEMARRADMPRVAVSYGAHAIDRLRAYEPRLCIDYFPDIMSLC